MPRDEQGAPWPDQSGGAPWPDPGQKAPFTWGTPADGPSFTWGHPSEGQTSPEVPYATWGRRAAGFLIDFALMAVAPVVFLVLFGIATPDTSNPNPPMSAVSWLWFWCLLASLTLFVFYPIWFIERRAQTPGMRKMQIRLSQVDREGKLGAPSQNCAWGRAFMAAVCWVFFFAWVLDYLWPLGDKRHQCIHDKVARTVAVDVRYENAAAE